MKMVNQYLQDEKQHHTVIKKKNKQKQLMIFHFLLKHVLKNLELIIKEMKNYGEYMLLLMDNVLLFLLLFFLFFIFLVILGANPASAHDFGLAVFNAINKNHFKN
jgi:hypothetical protein